MVALYSTEAGPAVGGCRMKSYARITDAVTDVLRLSKAMTLKCAAAGIPHSGAKSVIVVDRPLTPRGCRHQAATPAAPGQFAPRSAPTR